MNIGLSNLYHFTTSPLLPSVVSTENKVSNIFKIESLSQISTEQPSKTLFLFDLDDTIFDSFSMLGSKAWRRYIVEATKKIDISENWHDIFSFALAQKHPLKTVETLTSSFVKELQEKGHVVCGLTSRERKLWYNMPKDGVDILTIEQLNSVNVDFNNKSLENVYPYLSGDSEYFKGVFFANIDPKGDYLLHVFANATQYPEKIIFIDDKLSQVESVDNALSKLRVTHECYSYYAIDEKGKSFNPLIANIQLYYFYQSNGKEIISDQKASLIAKENPEKDAESYLRATLEIVKKAK